MSTAHEPPVHVRRIGAVTRITLQRPQAINALSLDMLHRMRAALTAAADDGSQAIVIDGAGERGLCGGGDIKEISSGDAQAFYQAEYHLDFLIHTSPVPVIALMDGIVMGGGIGISGHAAHRVVTERSRLAMPEVRIGIVPDVGGHLLLARAADRIGEYLAVTSGEFGSGDAIEFGFADRCVPSAQLPALIDDLQRGTAPEDAIAARAIAPPAGRLRAVAAWFAPLAEGALGSPHEPPSSEPVNAALRLADALAASPHPEARSTAETVRRGCPTSVAITLAQLDRTRREGLDLAEVLTDDFRILTRLSARPDFAEGVRAQVIDKDRNPSWDPARLELLDRGEIGALLAPSGPHEPVLDLGR